MRRAGWIYLVAAHLGVAFLFATFVLLGRQAGGLEFEAFSKIPALDAWLGGVDLRLGPRRIRGESGLCSVPRLASRSPPGRTVARLGLDVRA